MDTVHHLVAMPHPGRGHINPMLILCEQLLARAGRSLLVTFVVTEEWLGLLRAAAAPPGRPGFRFRTVPNVIPSELGKGADMAGFMAAVFTRLETPFEALLEKLEQEEEGEGEPPVSGIISDTLLWWAVAVGGRRGIPVYSLFTMSASFFSVLYHRDLILSHGRPPPDPTEVFCRFQDSVPGIPSLKMADVDRIISLEKIPAMMLQGFSSLSRAECLLFTSFYELEPRAAEALKAALRIPVYPVGPSIPYTATVVVGGGGGGAAAASYFPWLDSQPKSSVLYVSLGSYLSGSAEQTEEIATGLLASGVRFLWVTRRAPSRVLEMIGGGGGGLVVPWCDQLKVLCHPSVGGFLTHCGWNSTLEAVYAGVPMLTFPIFWDQPADSWLIVEDWKVGIRLTDEEGDGGVVGGKEIAEAARRLMDLDGEASKEMRVRSEKLKEACRAAVQAGGSSAINLDAFVEQVVGRRGERSCESSFFY